MCTRAIRLCVMCMLLVLGLLPIPAGSPALAAASDEIGMSVRLVGADAATMGRQFDLLSAMQVKWIRTDFDWALVESQQGTFDWSYPDAIVSQAAARGIKVLAIVDYTPVWARPSGTSSHAPPIRTSDFAAFARAAAARYSAHGVRHWEIWNEPNAAQFWEPAPDANRYGEVFEAASSAIRSVDPGAVLLTGGLARGDDSPDGRLISQSTFLERLYASGTAQFADAIAIHPYTFPLLPAQSGQETGGFADLPALHALMSKHGDGAKKLWITEFGAATGTGAGAVSEPVQATALAQARDQVRAWDWAGPLIYYELRDGGTNPADPEQNFGLLRNDLSSKVAAGQLLTPGATG